METLTEMEKFIEEAGTDMANKVFLSDNIDLNDPAFVFGTGDMNLFSEELLQEKLKTEDAANEVDEQEKSIQQEHLVSEQLPPTTRTVKMVKQDKASSALLTSSEVVFDYYCDPCSTDDLYVGATGYCESCEGYMCDPCGRYYVSLHYKVDFFDKATMPKDTITPKIKDTLTETCLKHKDKVLEYFCYTHNKLCCTVCFNLDHKSCQEKSYIPDISAETANTGEYTNLVTELNQLVDKASIKQVDIEMNHHDMYAYRIKAIDAIKANRKRIDQMLDKMCEDSFRKLEKLRYTQAQKIGEAALTCETVLTDVQQMASSLNKKETGKMNNQLFVDMKIIQSRVPTMENKLRDVADSSISRNEFKKVLAELFSLKSQIHCMLEKSSKLNKSGSLSTRNNTDFS